MQQQLQQRQLQQRLGDAKGRSVLPLYSYNPYRSSCPSVKTSRYASLARSQMLWFSWKRNVMFTLQPTDCQHILHNLPFFFTSLFTSLSPKKKECCTNSQIRMERVKAMPQRQPFTNPTRAHASACPCRDSTEAAPSSNLSAHSFAVQEHDCHCAASQGGG